tara:strand:+ start:81 stop:470 length:390 start_codon:yes stop_codon:yes gene_type:complete
MREVVQVIRQSHDPDKHVANTETLIFYVDIENLSLPLKQLFNTNKYRDYDVHVSYFNERSYAEEDQLCIILNDMKSLIDSEKDGSVLDDDDLLEIVRCELFDGYNRKPFNKNEDILVGIVKFSGIIFHC